MTAFFLIGRGADVSIGPDIDNKGTSLLPNDGSEGYGGGRNEGASYKTMILISYTNFPYCFFFMINNKFLSLYVLNALEVNTFDSLIYLLNSRN